MRRLLRSERGAVTAEYGGLILVVGALVLALAVSGPGVGRMIASGVQRAVCSVFAGCEAGGAGSQGEVDPGGGASGDAEEEGGGGVLGTLGDIAGGAWNGVQQVGGVFKGAGEGLWEMGTGLVDLGWNLGKASVKSSALWFVVDREGWEQQWEQNAGVVSYVWNNPGEVASGIWHGIADPIAEDWRNGNYGEAVGRGVVELLGAVFGGKGLNKLGRAGGAVDDAADLGRVDDLADAGRPRLELPPGRGENPWIGPIVSTVTTRETVLYRVWGGDVGVEGAWLTPVKPTSSAAARSGLALPPENAALYVSEVRVPAGIRIQTGTAGPAFEQPGGLPQVQLLEEIPGSAFGKGEPLDP